MTHNFGGQAQGTGSVVHLAHANGFPPGTYRLLAETLTDRFQVIALPSRPLRPECRPESAPTWRPLADDLVLELDDLHLSPIVGVGHSLGGVLTLWAAIHRPDLFRAVILIDPVILPPPWLWTLWLLRRVGLAHRQPLVQGALRRRRVWPSRQACYEHFKGKPLFTHWLDAALQDYVESGTRPRPDGQVELVYPPEWEAHIFATTPTDVWRDACSARLSVPALVIHGEHSNTFLPAAEARLARRLPGARFVTISGAGHLVPMERPAEAGAAIRDFLAQ
jgi:pimeloyl-ACP methyl ester carboxylesterase